MSYSADGEANGFYNRSKLAIRLNQSCVFSAILLTCIKRYLVLKPNFGLFESGRFTQVLLYSICRIQQMERRMDSIIAPN